MQSLTELIESHINELLQQDDSRDSVFLSRKDLAESFGCVPSQINYVLRSRFTPERGYLVESQRGGHGYIRIVRICYEQPEDRLNHIEEIVGDTISEQEIKKLLYSLQVRGMITARERLLIEVSLRYSEELSTNVFDISPYKKKVLQSQLLKRMLRGLALS